MFTRQHYAAIAKILGETAAPQATTEALADYFKTDNSRFDRERFADAVEKATRPILAAAQEAPIDAYFCMPFDGPNAKERAEAYAQEQRPNYKTPLFVFPFCNGYAVSTYEGR